jgi:hypothetical protein
MYAVLALPVSANPIDLGKQLRRMGLRGLARAPAISGGGTSGRSSLPNAMRRLAAARSETVH